VQRDGGPGGAGGAGNPVGGSFTGAAQGLQIAGDFGYAYSGSVDTAAQGVEVTTLEFTIGNHMLVGTLTPYSVHSAAHGDDIQFKVVLNDALIMAWILESTNTPNSPSLPGAPILLTAYSTLKVTIANLSGATARAAAVGLVGRLYRG